MACSDEERRASPLGVPLVRIDRRIERPVISKHTSPHCADDRSPLPFLERLHLGNGETALGDRYGFAAALYLVENAQAVRLEFCRANPLAYETAPPGCV
jgi:hypothetical protein